MTFLANFGCSDAPEVCKIDVTVIDETVPTPYCHYGLAIALMGIDTDNDGINDEGMVEVWASDLDAGSFASCNTGEAVSFSFSSDPTDNVRVFTCDDVGRNDVEIWVTDADGQQSYCNTYVRVQNNSANIEDCEDSDNYSSLSGHLNIHYGGHPDEVTLKAEGTSHVGVETPVMTYEIVETYVDSFQNQTGTWIYFLDIDTVWTETMEMIYPTQSTYLTNFGELYTFQELEHYHDYTIEVISEDENINRVNRGDLVELKAYLEGIITFTPFQKLAADINQDGIINTDDYDLLNDYINNPSQVNLDVEWHFFSEGMDMENMDSSEDCVEFCIVNDLQEDTYKVNLIGYRLGDITDVDVDAVLEESESISAEISDVSSYIEHFISPNPFVNAFNVELKNAEIGNAVFVLKDQSGQVILTRSVMIENTSSIMNINVDKPLLAGVYVYEIRTKTEVLTGKLIKI